MSATPAVTPPAPELCHGLKIEYKAYARPFLENTKDAVLYLIATCMYGQNGFTVYFEESEPNKFRLMEQPPSGIVHFSDTFYVASWPPPTGAPAETPVPSHVTIVDAHGEHRVHVRQWA
jgi:hypothetical protein